MCFCGSVIRLLIYYCLCFLNSYAALAVIVTGIHRFRVDCCPYISYLLSLLCVYIGSFCVRTEGSFLWVSFSICWFQFLDHLRRSMASSKAQTNFHVRKQKIALPYNLFVIWLINSKPSFLNPIAELQCCWVTEVLVDQIVKVQPSLKVLEKIKIIK